MRALRAIALFPFRAIVFVLNTFFLEGPELFGGRGDTHARRLADREARKRVERHGTE